LESACLNTVYIGLGTNKGDRIVNLRKAIELISKIENIEIKKASSIYETLPFGNTEQANFLNAVIKLCTSVNYSELFFQLKGIEKKLGRIQSEKWGPREIDLDILLFNNLIFSDEIITLPHKGLIYRDFVLVPLNEIEPGLVHPVFNKKISDFIPELKTKNIIRKIAESILLKENKFE